MDNYFDSEKAFRESVKKKFVDAIVKPIVAESSRTHTHIIYTGHKEEKNADAVEG